MRINFDNLAASIKCWLDKNDSEYSFDNENGLFRFDRNFGSPVGKIDYKVRVRDLFFSVLAYSPFDVPFGSEGELCEKAGTIGWLFSDRSKGAFDLDMEEHRVLYRYSVSCDRSVPTPEFLEASFDIPNAVFRKYGSVITDILRHNLSSMRQILIDVSDSILPLSPFRDKGWADDIL